jgi:hypothetical protein
MSCMCVLTFSLYFELLVLSYVPLLLFARKVRKKEVCVLLFALCRPGDQINYS